MKFFDDLDMIIEAAVGNVMSDERKQQKKQSKTIDKLGLRASDNSKANVDEAEADEEKDEDEEKLKGDAGDKPKETDTPGTATSKKLKDPSRSQIKNPSFKAIAANINLLRGGKSIKDPEVRKNLQDYLDKLEKQERRDVLVYLNSLAQVMAGVKSGSAAADPEQIEKKVAKKPRKKRDDTKANVIVVGE